MLFTRTMPKMATIGRSAMLNRVEGQMRDAWLYCESADDVDDKDHANLLMSSNIIT
jgi:hypothetical protein